MKFKKLFESDNWIKTFNKKTLEREKEIEKATIWGLFKYKENKYPIEDAIKTFKTKKMAEKELEKNKFEYVIRSYLKPEKYLEIINKK
jgi:hypothetical protein